MFAVAILLDQNGIFPKWMAYVSIWQIVTEVLAVPMFMFTAGPFAWNGSISFYDGHGRLRHLARAAVIVLLKKATDRTSPPTKCRTER